jgi:O-antigen ligase
MTFPDTATTRFTQYALGFTCLLILCALIPRIYSFLPALLGVTGSAWLYMQYRIRPYFDKQALITIITLVVMAGLSIIWSIEPAKATKVTLKIAAICLPAILCASVLRYAMPSRGTIALAVSFCIAATFCSTELAFDFPLYRIINDLPSEGGVYGPQMNRPMVILTFLLPLVAYAAYKKHKNFLIPLLCLICFAPALYLTDSQSAIIGLPIIAITACLPLRFKATWILLATTLTIAIFAAPFVIPPVFDNAHEHFAANPFLGNGGAWAGHRLEIWDAIATMIHEKPFLGYGVEAIRYTTNLPLDNLYHEGKTTLHPHNFTLQFWVEYGVVGAVMCAVLLNAIFYRLYTYRHLPATRWVLASFHIVIVLSAVGWGIWQSWWMGLLGFTYALGAALIYSEKENTKSISANA